jgi:hypothetical protein
VFKLLVDLGKLKKALEEPAGSKNLEELESPRNKGVGGNCCKPGSDLV